MLRVLLINTCLLAFLSSCGGTVSYKRGARPAALNTAQTECKSDGMQDKKAMEQCLEQKGWSVYQFDDADLFAEASESNEAYGGRQSESAFVSVADEKPSESPAPKVTESKTITKKKTVVTEVAKPAKAASQPSKKIEKISPLKQYKVSSWWKWGGGQQALENDLKTCEGTLGKAHKPDFKNQLVTRGFVICMYQKGWKALKVK